MKKIITLIISFFIRLLTEGSFKIKGLRFGKYKFVASFKVISLGENVHIDNNINIACKNINDNTSYIGVPNFKIKSKKTD